jgi:hypothetical protein
MAVDAPVPLVICVDCEEERKRSEADATYDRLAGK